MNQKRESKNAARQAAREEAERRRQAERRRTRRIRTAVIAGGVVVAAGVVAAVAIPIVHATSQPSAAAAGGSGTTWAVPSDVESAVKSAGLDMLTAEGTALHIHSHLSVTVDGTAVSVPAYLGIDEAAGEISPLHTHDDSGIIHVESPTVEDFTLGQVFDEWQVPLSDGTVGAYTDGQDGQTMTVFVDQKEYSGDPADIVLADHEDIDIVVTSAGETATAPAAFTWPEGY
ncbi:hypothetical protein [Microbacterium indicum]|uniref:hypothetical protein n=1 Tax=Microbacterium indicum TaxID=358100 RepID=UPI0003FF9A7A|nr:hypothetical protein [Microbacterium indicum]